MVAMVPPPRYREWIDFYFCREFKDPWDLDWDFEASPEDKAGLFAATMIRCGSDLTGCTDGQIAAGLKAIWLGDLCTIPHDVCKASENAKAAAVKSISRLYADVLAVRSPPVLGHLNEGKGTPLEYPTYMAWDVSPMTCLIGVTDGTGDRSLLVDVLSDALCIRPANPAVIESVLHGLGHLAGSHPKVREQITASIDYFLSHRPIVRPELKTYAEAARTGMIQ